MNVPKRQGNAPAIAESELQSLDALELAEALKPGMVSAEGRPDASSSTIAPVGLDLLPGRPRHDPPAVLSRAAPRRAQRRHVGLVIGTVAGCALILLAAGIARVVHASSTPSPPAALDTEVAPSTPAPQTANVMAAPAPASDGTTASTASDGTSSGTVRLARGLSPDRVLFDGKTLSSATALVSCGTHQVRVNRGRAHSVDVPCGGAIDVSK